MRILIIEDEARIAKRIERLCREILGDQIAHLRKCDALLEGRHFIDNHLIDLLFLDLSLNREDGFEILKNSVSGAFHTIIISAYTDRAIQAFEFGVLDFLPKPFDKVRLATALAKMTSAKPRPASQLKYVAIKKKGRVQLIDLDDVLYIKGAGIYTELHLKDGRTEVHDKSLEKLEQILPDHWERIHRSYLIDMNVVREVTVQSGTKYSVVLKNGEVLPVGRSRYKKLKEKWFW